MAAVIETEPELDMFMTTLGRRHPAAFRCTGHMAFAGGDVMRVIDKHHKRITHVHTKDVRMDVIDKLDRTQQRVFSTPCVKGAFTVPGDGSLDFAAIVGRLAAYGYEGWFVVEAEQDPKISPPARNGQKGHAELVRVMALAGYRGRAMNRRNHNDACVVAGGAGDSGQHHGAIVDRRRSEMRWAGES